MNNEQDTIIIPSEVEREKSWKRFITLYKWARSLSNEKVDFLCNAGWYNNTIYGYLIAAARMSEFSDEQISVLLRGLKHAFSEIDKSTAEKIYIKSDFRLRI